MNLTTSVSRVLRRLGSCLAALSPGALIGGASTFGVVGGQSIPVASAPWAVYVQDKSGSCSGSILDPSHVLTAGHCVVDSATGAADSPSQLVVTAGVSNFRHPRSSDVKQIRRAAAVTVFPK